MDEESFVKGKKVMPELGGGTFMLTVAPSFIGGGVHPNHDRAPLSCCKKSLKLFDFIT